MTVKQVADALGLRRGRIYDLIRTKQLPAVHFGRQVRVSEAALLEFIEAGGCPLEEEAVQWRG
jgi:excisionase family DNA binding protein